MLKYRAIYTNINFIIDENSFKLCIKKINNKELTQLLILLITFALINI